MAGQTTALVKRQQGWAKGQSGNPSGRPRSDHDVGAMCRALTPRAVHALDLALDDPARRVGAAAIILERGWGKVPQPVSAADGDGNELTLLHLIAARQIAEQMQALMTGGALEPKANGATNGSAAHNGESQGPVIDLSIPALE